MKVLLIAPKDSPTYLNSLYASLRVQVGTCDLYALNDKQSAALQTSAPSSTTSSNYNTTTASC